MYLAEIRGKLSPRMECMEDILTSNVFSFFKYASREVFFCRYLKILGFSVSAREAGEAQFLFWPRYEDQTEPDLVIIVGDYYLLIEAKYFSDFAEETQKTEAQLTREITNGINDAKNYGKRFSMIAITADSYRREERGSTLPVELRPYCVWTNWQTVAGFLYRTIQTDLRVDREDAEFARDLYDLLDKKHLRGFQGLDMLSTDKMSYEVMPYLFFDARTARFRGDFIGFDSSLSQDSTVAEPGRYIFLDRTIEFFRYHKQVSRKLRSIATPIFYEEVKPNA